MNKARQKGTTWEVAVRDYLAERWPELYRPAQAGRLDAGDLVGSGYLIECKATRQIDLAGGMDELARIRVANGPRGRVGGVGVLVVKRRMRSVGSAYAVMTLEDWRECIQ